jgi:hypothetical protein
MEAATRRHRVQYIADCELARSKLRKGTTGLDTDADLEGSFIDSRADAVGTPDLLAIDLDLERQVLSGQEFVF